MDDNLIRIESERIALGPSLQEYCVRHIKKLVHAKGKAATGCLVNFKLDAIYFECDLSLDTTTGAFDATARGGDAYSAFGSALDKLAKEIARGRVAD